MLKTIITFLLLLCSFCFTQCLSNKLAIKSCNLDIEALPITIQPKHYNVQIEPNLDSATFAGTLAVQVKYHDLNQVKANKLKKFLKRKFSKSNLNQILEQSSDRIILMNVGQLIELDEIQVVKFAETKSKGQLKLTEKSNKSTQREKYLKIESICHDKSKQLLAIKLAKRLVHKQKLRLLMKFHGKIADDSLEIDWNRHQRHHARYFVPTNASSVFPCFDDPDFVSTFKLKLIFNSKYQAIANSRLQSFETSTGLWGRKNIAIFERTPKISVDAFAFALGSYDTPIRCQPVADSTFVSLYVPKGEQRATSTGKLAVDIACKAIKLIEKHLGIKYPLRKLDLIVSKQTLTRPTHAMLILEPDLMLVDVADDGTSLDPLRFEIAKLLVHNILHGCFSEIEIHNNRFVWLFNGFLAWQSHRLVSNIFPEFEPQFDCLLTVQSPLLDANELVGSKNKPSEVWDPKDGINKALALYRMIDSFIGNGILERAMLASIKQRHNYINGDHFFVSIEQQTSLMLEPIVRSWTEQAGHPMLIVMYEESKVEIYQQQFVSKSELYRNDLVSEYIVPITVHISDGDGREEHHKILMKETSIELELPIWFDMSNSRHWFKLNQDFGSFYRVDYTNNLYRRLRRPIQSETLNQLDRFNLVDDIHALLRHDYMNYRGTQRALSWFKNEQSGLVLSGLVKVVPTLAIAHQNWGLDFRETQQFVHQQFGSVYDRFGLDDRIYGQHHTDLIGRQAVLSLLIRYNYPLLVEDALELFQNRQDLQMQSSLRAPVYECVVLHGTEEQFDEMIRRLSEDIHPAIRQALATSLARHGNKSRRARLVQLQIDTNG